MNNGFCIKAQRFILKAVTVFMVVSFAFVATAQESQTAQDPQFNLVPLAPDEWRACKAHKDCRGFLDKCGGQYGVNAAYFDQYQEIVTRSRENIQCTIIPEVTEYLRTTSVICMRGQCMAYIPNTGADPMWYFCRQDSDCGRVIESCNMPAAVNVNSIENYKAFRAKVDSYLKNTPIKPPACTPEIEHIAQRLSTTHDKCVMNRCTLVQSE